MDVWPVDVMLGVVLVVMGVEDGCVIDDVLMLDEEGVMLDVEELEELVLIEEGLGIIENDELVLLILELELELLIIFLILPAIPLLSVYWYSAAGFAFVILTLLMYIV